jgi:hypothetical protein
MDNGDNISNVEGLQGKRASTYRFAVCTYCKIRHAPPSGNDCINRMLDCVENGESPLGKGKKSKLPTFQEANETVTEEEAGQGAIPKKSPALEQQPVGDGDAAEGESEVAHMARFMVAYCRKMDSSMRGLQEDLLQLRRDSQARPSSSRQLQPSLDDMVSHDAFHDLNSPIHTHPVAVAKELQVPSAASGGAAGSLTPHLVNLRQDPVLARQANALVDRLDNEITGIASSRYSKTGFARSGGESAPPGANTVASKCTYFARTG